MAKFYLAFEPCDNEFVPYVFDFFAQISMLAVLKPAERASLEKFDGALRLRRFRAGDVICRQGAEDCTAYYLLKAEDLDALARYPVEKRTGQIELEKSATEQKIADLEAALAKALADANPKDTDKLRKQLKDQQEKLAGSLRELDRLPKLQAKLTELPDPTSNLPILHAGDEANLHLKRREDETLKTDKKKAATLRTMRSADAAKKHGHADACQADDPELANWLRASAAAAVLRKAAVVHLVKSPQPEKPSSASRWNQITRAFSRTPAKSPAPAPRSVPFDGPTEVSWRTREANLFEGDLFGEMACMYRAPRSASVIAHRDCFVLEMLSNVLADIDKPKSTYRAERDRIYEERVLDLQLRDLSIFADLDDDQFARTLTDIRPQVSLRLCTSGEVICDEHEPSDCVYLVRSGLVQVKTNVSSLLSVADIRNWKDFVALLCRPGPAAAWYALAPADTRKLIESIREPERIAAADQAAIVDGINTVLKSSKPRGLPELKEIIADVKLHERVRGAASFQAPRKIDANELKEVIKSVAVREAKEAEPTANEEWSELDERRFNRFLLEELVPHGLRRLPPAAAVDTVRTYLSRGEFIGEMGVCRRQPRNATCIAFGQPCGPSGEDLGQIELVRIPGDVFLHLMELFPAIKARVDAEIAIREEFNVRHAKPTEDSALNRAASKEVQRLGLIQGQKLMLIDMDRCTLCQECVKGCIEAHTDGRSRLFLTGHRFDKYMVPITCRSCLDPVCMIGCPVRSIQRGHNHEMVIKDWCIGCSKCAKNCPYDAIKMHEAWNAAKDEETELAVVCDLCSELPDQEPRCVYCCPHEAATRVNGRLDLPVL